MALSPLRAVVTAHQQGLVNRARRQLGRNGFVVFVLVVGTLATVIFLQAGVGMGVVGWFAGQAFFEGTAASCCSRRFCSRC